ncbi:hypothetical protein STA3757_00470 [Stanieria sp. NIES-3757]|nr:hypothetical protein STA3757_00470 [Stanieria sp. NIES-3757]
MIISNLEFVEEVRFNEEAQVEGGLAKADARAIAYAEGRFISGTFAGTYTSVYSSKFLSSSYSGAVSSSYAE